MERRNFLATIHSTAPGGGEPVSFSYPLTKRHTVGMSVNLVPMVKNGVPPFAFSVLTGSLPSGLSLATNGTISGTLATVGDYSSIIQVQDNLGAAFPLSFTYKVTNGYRTVWATPTPGEIAIAYSYQVKYADASGNSTGFTYSVLSGSLPAGLSISSGGLISGTPTTFGTSYFTIRGTKSGQNLDVEMSLKVFRNIAGVGSTITASIPAAVVNQPMVEGSIAITDTYGCPPFRYEVTSNALPVGVKINRLTGKVTGTPTAITPSTGWSNPVVTVTDALGATRTVALPFQINQGVKAVRGRRFVVGDGADGTTDADHLSAFFGDGSDGDATLDGTTDPTWAPRVAGVNTLNRHAYVHDLTIVSGGRLELAGFDLYVSGTLNLDNAPANAVTCRNANPALTGTGAGVFGSIGTVGGSGSTASGGNSSGSSSNTRSAGGRGSAGGAGGHGGGSNTGGTAASAGSLGAQDRPRSMFQSNLAVRTTGVEIVYAGTGGTGGGGGGGNGTVSGSDGGTGGGAGGNATIRARTISRGASTAAGCISVRGNNGGNSSNVGSAGGGSGGGGGGGGGGFLRLYYGDLEGTPATNALDAGGGAGGNAGTISGGLGVTRGTGGSGGDGGAIVVGDILNGTGSITVGASGSGPTTSTGGAGGTCQSDL